MSLARDSKPEGNDPVSEFRERSRINNSDKFPNEEDILPVRLLPDKYKYLSVLNPASDRGIDPVTELDLRSSTWSALSLWPNQSGIGLGSENPEALKDTKLVKLAKESTANC